MNNTTWITTTGCVGGAISGTGWTGNSCVPYTYTYRPMVWCARCCSHVYETYCYGCQSWNHDCQPKCCHQHHTHIHHHYNQPQPFRNNLPYDWRPVALE